MVRTLLALALVLCAIAIARTPAHAATTLEFLDLCANDEEACGQKIHDVRATLERSGTKLCFPDRMPNEGLVGEVTYWITEQQPPLDKDDDSKSIAAALTALYSCARIQPLEGTKP